MDLSLTKCQWEIYVWLLLRICVAAAAYFSGCSTAKVLNFMKAASMSAVSRNTFIGFKNLILRLLLILSNKSIKLLLLTTNIALTSLIFMRPHQQRKKHVQIIH